VLLRQRHAEELVRHAPRDRALVSGVLLLVLAFISPRDRLLSAGRVSRSWLVLAQKCTSTRWMCVSPVLHPQTRLPKPLTLPSASFGAKVGQLHLHAPLLEANALCALAAFPRTRILCLTPGGASDPWATPARDGTPPKPESIRNALLALPLCELQATCGGPTLGIGVPVADPGVALLQLMRLAGPTSLLVHWSETLQSLRLTLHREAAALLSLLSQVSWSVLDHLELALEPVNASTHAALRVLLNPSHLLRVRRLALLGVAGGTQLPSMPERKYNRVTFQYTIGPPLIPLRPEKPVLPLLAPLAAQLTELTIGGKLYSVRVLHADESALDLLNAIAAMPRLRIL
jgi:hypothetical protein